MAQLSMDDLMFRPGLMQGERVLITGGGTGLGKVMAEACLMLGAEVYIWGRRGNVIEDAAKELMEAHGGKCVGMACDIRVPEAIHDAMDQVWADGALTGLVNNAAGNFISRTEDLSPRGFDAIANIVFRGSFFVTLDAGKRWLAEGRPASVVSILTTWVWHGLCERPDHRHRRRLAPHGRRLLAPRLVGRQGMGGGPQRHPLGQREGPGAADGVMLHRRGGLYARVSATVLFER